MESPTSRPIRILLVEDNPGDVILTREAFSAAKINNLLSVAKDGEQALEMLQKDEGYEDTPTPDLILLDLNMPKKDGSEVLAELKADEKLRHIPVLILTSSKAEQDVVKSYDLNANSYLIKPVDIEQFIEVVRSIEGFWLSVVVQPPE